jgi:hypothetical protein
MEAAPRSPRVTHLAWGHIEVEGQPNVFRDAKLFPGGARAWDWRETGTAQPADVDELLQHGATVIVLSQGMLERLRICAETLHLLEVRGIPFHVLRTEAAVRRYNELAIAEPVAGLFHSTC